MAGSQPLASWAAAKEACRINLNLSQRNLSVERPGYRLGFMNAGPELLSR